MNIKNYGVADYLKLVANVAGAGAVGFATAGYAGLALAIVANAAALFQAPPAHTTEPN